MNIDDMIMDFSSTTTTRCNKGPVQHVDRPDKLSVVTPEETN